MKMTRRFRPVLENLENRYCPTLNLSYNAGILMLTGTPPTGPTNPQELHLSMPSAGVVRVQEVFSASTLTLGNFANVRDLRLNLVSFNTNINFDLNGNAFGGNITYSLGRGDTDLT